MFLLRPYRQCVCTQDAYTQTKSEIHEFNGKVQRDKRLKLIYDFSLNDPCGFNTAANSLSS